MNNWLLGFLVMFSATAAGEAFLLLGRIRQFLTYAQQIAELGGRLTAAMPSKQPRTNAGDDYLDHLARTTDNPALQRAVADVQAEQDTGPIPVVGRHRKPSPRPRSVA